MRRNKGGGAKAKPRRARARGTPKRAWERGWEGHERAQRLRFAAIPLPEKIRGLEEMHRIVLGLAGK